ncbi:periplasmic binding protein [Xylanimonas cellulosilytica DSM 15894]|uniref:Periplasmic binding protein n=1 Tax=Xylanimonas cellulosilytica (strain DSM 15894 / JCM 12276 / CECT 5975 / KCTC 9989 / LMG 20990 / NBRC 107835 / XIL07) TaxID=446471 RepID=D1BUV4_XYLCX|nr:iron-siderophore ABC transporter substrate-binding protein [Xylanimonas cellulosilytica]ACZ31193.1 periplasmic binding protein [Xylanimonas cellulosilytica DSM 15894]
MRLRRSLAVTTALVAGATLALAGCGSSTPETPGGAATDAATDAPTGGATDSFPITVTSALGETTIEEEPVRVATWGWGSTEAAVALGVFPVAVAEQRWTVGEGNLLPWVEEAFDAAGAEHPALLTDDGTGATVPYEEFVAAEPDLILAPYSGLTQEQFDLLSEIAPVVAYQDGPWTTTWDDVITISAEALGRTAAGEEVLAGISDFLAEARAAHPEFEGKTFAGVWDGDGVMSVYTAADARAAILVELGLQIAPSVGELDSSDGGFYFDLSYEKIDALTADFLIMYGPSEEEVTASLAKPELQAIPAIAAGQVVKVYDPVTVSSVSPPTALSFQWEGGMPSLIESIAALLAE